MGQVRDDRFKVRAVVLGSFFVVLVSVWATYSEFIVRASRLNMSNFALALFVPFVLCALIVNPVLKARKPEWAFGRSDLLVALTMGLASAVIPAADGLPGYLLGILAAPFYFATPENGWAPYLHNHIRPWMAPSEDRQAMTWFFEGLPPGQAVPWGEWVLPLFWWLSFIGAAACVSICLAVLLRRQWVDHEKLVYPLANVAVDLVSAPKHGIRMIGGRLFWAGAVTGFGMIAWNILSYFSPGAPKFPTGSYRSGTSLPLGRNFPGIRIKLNLFTIGFVYFANLEVLFSVWFFYVLNVFQVGILRRLGFGLNISDSWGSSYEVAGWEGFGALTVFVGWGLWMARRHFYAAFRSAFSGDQERRRFGRDDGLQGGGMGDVYRTGVSGVVATRGGDGLWCSHFVCFSNAGDVCGSRQDRGGDRADLCAHPVERSGFYDGYSGDAHPVGGDDDGIGIFLCAGFLPGTVYARVGTRSPAGRFCAWQSTPSALGCGIWPGAECNGIDCINASPGLCPRSLSF